ncbi:hypothetical protein WIS52_02275 [Pseudonocardia nematodicida]|uniref:mRNA interferase MazF n=1 Tax=Pseudonocardia nematodicida TaxID=1206997 RepID=A0ABV1K4B5_9PSEU
MIRRGEVWAYRPALERPGQSLARLIVSASGINDDEGLPTVVGLKVLDSDPGGLLAVRVDPHGWASALTIEPVLRPRLTERLGEAPGESMEQVERALTAMLDL